MQNKPEVHLCTKRNRVKNYSNNYYLQNKQEFEFELFNPTDSTQLAKISINGKLISKAGIVLKPGVRIYLERFIDTPEKFKFETYEVEDSSAAQMAIENNGEVRIDFYQEETPIIPLNVNYTYIGDVIRSNHLGSTTIDFFCDTSSTASGQSLNSPLYKIKGMVSSKPIETGRVEKGNSSGQNFTNYSGNFNSYISSSVSFRILPVSTKPVEGKDLVLYCTNCGAKQKQNNKFCPSCGNKH